MKKYNSGFFGSFVTLQKQNLHLICPGSTSQILSCKSGHTGAEITPRLYYKLEIQCLPKAQASWERPCWASGLEILRGFCVSNVLAWCRIFLQKYINFKAKHWGASASSIRENGWLWRMKQEEWIPSLTGSRAFPGCLTYPAELSLFVLRFLC